jgi:hypothetical protein
MRLFLHRSLFFAGMHFIFFLIKDCPVFFAGNAFTFFVRMFYAQGFLHLLFKVPVFFYFDMHFAFSCFFLADLLSTFLPGCFLSLFFLQRFAVIKNPKGFSPGSLL